MLSETPPVPGEQLLIDFAYWEADINLGLHRIAADGVMTYTIGLKLRSMSQAMFALDAITGLGKCIRQALPGQEIRVTRIELNDDKIADEGIIYHIQLWMNNSDGAINTNDLPRGTLSNIKSMTITF